MNRCDEHAADIQLYLRDELTGQKLDGFREHLESCPDCSAQLEEELALSLLLRKSRPLYSAPETLRARVAATVVQELSTSAGVTDPVGAIRLQGFARWLSATESKLSRQSPLLPGSDCTDSGARLGCRRD
jgi:mycothiol system anti-sigma-R factor